VYFVPESLGHTASASACISYSLLSGNIHFTAFAGPLDGDGWAEAMRIAGLPLDGDGLSAEGEAAEEENFEYLHELDFFESYGIGTAMCLMGSTTRS
jgi:hypothetical protein